MKLLLLLFLVTITMDANAAGKSEPKCDKRNEIFNCKLAGKKFEYPFDETTGVSTILGVYKSCDKKNKSAEVKVQMMDNSGKPRIVCATLSEVIAEDKKIREARAKEDQEAQVPVQAPNQRSKNTH